MDAKRERTRGKLPRSPSTMKLKPLRGAHQALAPTNAKVRRACVALTGTRGQKKGPLVWPPKGTTRRPQQARDLTYRNARPRPWKVGSDAKPKTAAIKGSKYLPVLFEGMLELADTVAILGP